MSLKTTIIVCSIVNVILLGGLLIKSCNDNHRIEIEKEKKVISTMPDEWQRVYSIMLRASFFDRVKIFKKLQKEYKLSPNLSAEQLSVFLDLFYSDDITEISEYFAIEK